MAVFYQSSWSELDYYYKRMEDFLSPKCIRYSKERPIATVW